MTVVGISIAILGNFSKPKVNTSNWILSENDMAILTESGDNIIIE
jgi:hypothetical protein